MIGYIYKTTNIINGKVYIGKHYASQYDAKYFGSGKVLKQAIHKYGLMNFINELIDIAETDEELNTKEKYYIGYYKSIHKDNCYNLANGGQGGDVFKYQTDEAKQVFIAKMTTINRGRCNTDEFKRKLSIATTNRYKDIDLRKRHAQKIKNSWSDARLRYKQSEKLKTYYRNHKRDCSFNCIQCVFKLKDTEIKFQSIKELRKYLLEEYQYIPDRRTFNKLLRFGAQGIPYKPFHKNNKKLQKLNGMIIYKINKSVETNGDECNQVGEETGTSSKSETVKQKI